MILLIAPAGVGIREGALVYIVTRFSGYNLTDILGVAVSIRLLIIICECFYFLCALYLKIKIKKITYF